MAVKKMAKKPDPAADLATKLVAALQAKKTHGDYPISLRRLAEAADPETSPDVLLAAVGKTPFTKAAFLVKPPDKNKGVTLPQVMESPVGLWEDATLVACHASTLAFVRSSLPQGALADWKKWVNNKEKGALKKPFGEFLDAQFGPEAVAAGLLDALKKNRDFAASGKSLTLQRLVEIAGVNASREVLKKAVSGKQFTEHAFLVKPPGKDFAIEHALASPVALWDDAKNLALLPSTVDFVRRAYPGGSHADWKRWVCGKPRKDFRDAFALVLETHLPKRLLEVLRSQKLHAPAGYPLTIRQLAELGDRTPDAEAAAAVMGKTFVEAAIVAAPQVKKLSSADLKALMEARVALREDIDLLAGSPELLTRALRDSRRDKDLAFTIEELVKASLGNWDKDLKQRFAHLAAEKLASGSAPETMGWITKNGKSLLFFREDMFPRSHRIGKQAGQAEVGSPRVPAAPDSAQTSGVGLATSRLNPSSASDLSKAGDSSKAVDEHFAAKFEDAFRRLDGEKGSYNFVSLLDLRRALSDYSREQFDRGLKLLRQARRYRINVGEGRSGVSPEQQEAAIIEDGTIHSSVSRIKS